MCGIGDPTHRSMGGAGLNKWQAYTVSQIRALCHVRASLGPTTFVEMQERLTRHACLL
jgi:hypothetical protein